MVCEGTATNNGPRIAPLVEPEGPDVQVILGHISRAAVKPGAYPRNYELHNLPASLRVYVATDDGVLCPVRVRVKLLDGHIYAHGHQDFICRGEDESTGGEFLRKNELEAEARALAML